MFKRLGMALIIGVLASQICVLAAERELQWCERTWLVKAGAERGPGPNHWSDSEQSVWIDDKGLLHLKLRQIDGVWHCPEIWSKERCGYGSYHFELGSAVQGLDPNLVLGLFAYADDDNEVDVEISNWGEAGPAQSQFVVQPYHKAGQLSRASLLGEGIGLRYVLDWQADLITCTATLGEKQRQWSLREPRHSMPKAEGARMHLNLWLFRGKAPINQKEQEVVIKRAWFVPAPILLHDAEADE